MDQLLPILIAFGILTVVAILVYAFSFRQNIITSSIQFHPAHITGDQFYYLPQGKLSVTVTATISVVKTVDDQSIIRATVQSLSFAPTVKIEPDPTALVAIRYNGNWFANDELQITTSAAGLLENVVASSEDRISNVVAMFIQLPKPGSLESISNKEAFVATPLLTETVTLEVVQTFEVLTTEMADGEISRIWQIPLTGISPDTSQIADASFKLTTPTKLERKTLTGTAPFNGLFLRPSIAQEWILDQPSTMPASFTCIVPDTRCLLKLPIKRVRFVKSQQLPKFQNGMLTTNTISKPSEAEGLASIPVNILKAIVSIPARLFQFRISRVQEDTKLQEALAALEKLKADKEKGSIEDRLQQLKTDLDEEKLRQLRKNGSAPQPGRPQLGKLPPKDPEEDIAENLLEIHKNFREEFLRPETPEEHDWSNGLDIWDEYQNNTLKTCVPAAAAHLRKTWTMNAHPPMKLATSATVLDTLKQVAPGHDITKGCYMSDFMNYWQDPGMDGVKIDRFIKFRIKIPDILKEATYWFGGCMIGLQLPQSALNKDKWDFPSSEPENDNIKWGGHTVCVLGYTKKGFIVISWGRRIIMSPAFYKRFNDESFVALSSTDWTTQADKSPTKGNLAFAALSNLMDDIHSA